MELFLTSFWLEPSSSDQFKLTLPPFPQSNNLFPSTENTLTRHPYASHSPRNLSLCQHVSNTRTCLPSLLPHPKHQNAPLWACSSCLGVPLLLPPPPTTQTRRTQPWTTSTQVFHHWNGRLYAEQSDQAISSSWTHNTSQWLHWRHWGTIHYDCPPTTWSARDHKKFPIFKIFISLDLSRGKGHSHPILMCLRSPKLSVSDSATLATTKVAYAISESLNKLDKCKASDWFLGESYVDNKWYASGWYMKQLKSNCLKFFKLVILTHVVHREGSKHLRLKNNCFWFATTLFNLIILLFSNNMLPLTPEDAVREQRYLLHNLNIINMTGCWMGLKVTISNQKEISAITTVAMATWSDKTLETGTFVPCIQTGSLQSASWIFKKGKFFEVDICWKCDCLLTVNPKIEHFRFIYKTKNRIYIYILAN